MGKTAKPLVFVKSDAEVNEFVAKYANLIFWVIKGMPTPIQPCDAVSIYNDILISYASGRLGYDPSRSSMSTYLTLVVTCRCKDYLRSIRRQPCSHTEDEAAAESVMDERASRLVDREGFAVLIIEGLCRFSSSIKDEKRMGMFVDYLNSKGKISMQSIQAIAEDYDETDTYVSVNCSTRMLPKFKKIMTKVMAEESEGKLRLSRWKNIEYLADKFSFSTNVFEKTILRQEAAAAAYRMAA